MLRNQTAFPMSNRLWDKQQLAFRHAIREIRVQAGLTQTELAHRLRKPQSYISKYENGERRLDYLEVRDICDQCGYSVEEFEVIYTTHSGIQGRN